MYESYPFLSSLFHKVKVVHKFLSFKSTAWIHKCKVNYKNGCLYLFIMYLLGQSLSAIEGQTWVILLLLWPQTDCWVITRMYCAQFRFYFFALSLFYRHPIKTTLLCNRKISQLFPVIIFSPFPLIRFLGGCLIVSVNVKYSVASD